MIWAVLGVAAELMRRGELRAHHRRERDRVQAFLRATPRA